MTKTALAARGAVTSEKTAPPKPALPPHTSAALVDELRARLALTSDYQVAKLLGVTRSSVSLWRLGHGHMSDATALKVAEYLDADPLWVLLRVWESRSDSPGARHVAQRVLEELREKGRAVVRRSRQASVLLALAVGVAAVSPAPTEACPLYAQVDGGSVYILLNRRRRQISARYRPIDGQLHGIYRPPGERRRRFLSWLNPPPFPALTA